jgi:acetyltransferase-like isoleucine patch superfamily enzyme
MTVDRICARIRGYRAGHGKTSALRVYPRAKVKVARSASFDIVGLLRLGACWPNGRYFPSLAYFGKESRTTVSGDFSIFSNFSLGVADGAELHLGSGFFNYGSYIVCTTKISIGNDCMFGDQLIIRDDDFHYIDDHPRSAPITIGDRVWAGMRVTILKGVTIGEGAVIAAGAVVTKDVPPHSLVGGVPARVLRRGITWRP